jgi:hypothetical protein
MFALPLFRTSKTLPFSGGYMNPQLIESAIQVAFTSTAPAPLLVEAPNLIYLPLFSPKPSDKRIMFFLLRDSSYKYLTLGSSLRWLCLFWSIQTPQNIILKGHSITPMSALLHSQNGYIHL